MELKLKKDMMTDAPKTVLIVPLWNWNDAGNAWRNKYSRSNRTFMELKWRRERMA